MEEELSKSELKSDESSSDKEISQTQTRGKLDKTDELKFKDQDDQLDSTCESILSSINEECNKISREKENGIEENSMNSTDGQAESSISSEDRNGEESKHSEGSGSRRDDEEVEYDHLHGALEIDESDNLSSSPKNAEVDLNSVDKKAKMDTSNNSNGSSQSAHEEGKTENFKDLETKKIGENTNANYSEEKSSEKSVGSIKGENTNANYSEEKSSEKSVGSIKICSSIFSNIDNNDNSENNEMSTENESKSNCDQEDSKEKENSGGKIKLRSFASLCGNEDHGANDSDCMDSSCKLDGPMTNLFSSEISGVAVGDIVQHSNIVESDESGVMHLKISNVVGGEDCITGLTMDDEKETFLPIQISSIASLIEPVSPDVTSCEKGINDTSVAISSNENGDSQQWMLDSSKVSDVSTSVQTSIDDTKLKSLCSSNSSLSLEKEKGHQTIINIFRSPLVVGHSCEMCKKHMKCEFRIVSRKPDENKVGFICSESCKAMYIVKLPKDHKVVKPRIFFERVCGKCGKELTGLSKSSTHSWQTREFCNKLCLADHIGEVARQCFCCKNPVRVIYMVKYCVRFGSDVHQFCSNGCLERFKSTIKVCSFCQKNLTDITKVISPSNKEYCSNKCLKRAQRKDISQQHYKEEIDCTVCCKKVVNKYEFLHNGATTWLCSDPCLNVFKYAKQVKSVNCCLCARLLNAEESCIYFFNGKKQLGLRVFCTESCFSVFVISARKIVTCEYCKVKKYNFDMICSASETLDEEFYSCSVCCLNFIENQNKNIGTPSELLALKPAAENDASITSPLNVVNSNNSAVTTASNSSTGPLLKECNMCAKVEPAQFHMVMSDSTLRSFCSYVCATRFKCTFGFQVSGGSISGATDKDELLKLKKDGVSGSDENGKADSVSTKSAPKFDPKAISDILALFNPAEMSNKSTMCRPIINTKGIQCKPHQWHKDMQTDESSLSDKAVILPIPFPVYVPTPMMMFSAPTPVPLFIPIPIPIPVFIPTVEKTTKELEKRIKGILEKFPNDPKESEMIMLADNEVKNKNDSETSSVAENEGTDSIVENNIETSPVTESDAMITEEQTVDDESAESDLELIGRIQETLSKFSHLQTNEDGDRVKSDSRGKRKLDPEIEEGPTLKKSKFDEDHLDLSYGVAVWSAWVKRKLMEDPNENSPNTQLLQEDLCNMSSDVLDHCLILFLEDLGLQKEVKIDVDSLFYLLLGIQKHIFEQGSTFCIFLEVNFDKFTDAFDDMVNAFYASHSQPGPGLSRRLLGTRVTEEMLWEARQLGAHTPHVLLNTLFYFNTKVFHLKDADDHSNLSFTQILKDWKKNKLAADVSVNVTSLLKFSPVKKGDTNSKTFEMLENKENPLRCPVKLYEFYLSKCPESIRNDRTKYYVYPEQTCQPDSPVWFSTSSLQISTIEKMLNRVLLVREVQEALFNNSS